jgi:hypothetical protein
VIRTILVLGAETTRRMKEHPGYLENLGYKSEFNQELGREVIVVNHKVLREIPSSLRAVVAFDFFVVEQFNSPYRGVPQGYYDGDPFVKARVVIDYRGGRLVQSFVVMGKDCELWAVGDYFDMLVAGKKNNDGVHTAPLPEPPLNLLAVRDEALRKVEEMIHADEGRYNHAKILEGDLEELRSILLGQPGVNLGEVREAFSDLSCAIRALGFDEVLVGVNNARIKLRELLHTD